MRFQAIGAFVPPTPAQGASLVGGSIIEPPPTVSETVQGDSGSTQALAEGFGSIRLVSMLFSWVGVLDPGYFRVSGASEVVSFYQTPGAGSYTFDTSMTVNVSDTGLVIQNTSNGGSYMVSTSYQVVSTH